MLLRDKYEWNLQGAEPYTIQSMYMTWTHIRIGLTAARMCAIVIINFEMVTGLDHRSPDRPNDWHQVGN